MRMPFAGIVQRMSNARARRRFTGAAHGGGKNAPLLNA